MQSKHFSKTSFAQGEFMSKIINLIYLYEGEYQTMRNLLKVLAIMVVIAMMAVAFVGCGACENGYENGNGYELNGNGDDYDVNGNGEENGYEVYNENGEVDNGDDVEEDVVCECEDCGDCDEDCEVCEEQCEANTCCP